MKLIIAAALILGGFLWTVVTGHCDRWPYAQQAAFSCYFVFWLAVFSMLAA